MTTSQLTLMRYLAFQNLHVLIWNSDTRALQRACWLPNDRDPVEWPAAKAPARRGAHQEDEDTRDGRRLHPN